MATTQLHSAVILEGNDEVLIRCNGGVIQIIQTTDDLVLVSLSCRPDVEGNRLYRIESGPYQNDYNYDISMVKRD